MVQIQDKNGQSCNDRLRIGYVKVGSPSPKVSYNCRESISFYARRRVSRFRGSVILKTLANLTP